MMNTQTKEAYFGPSYDPKMTNPTDEVMNVATLPPEMITELVPVALTDFPNIQMANLSRVSHNPGSVIISQSEIENTAAGPIKFIAKPKGKKRRSNNCFNKLTVSLLCILSIITLSLTLYLFQAYFTAEPKGFAC